MIFLHGRGGSAEDILQLYDEIGDKDFFGAAPQAPENSWYPYSFLAPIKNNELYIRKSHNILKTVIKEFSDKGIKEDKIVLVGFSQGACLTLEYIYRNPNKYGGVAALSGALITPKPEVTVDLQSTPVFLGCSENDPHIPLQRIELTNQIFLKMNAETQKRIFRGPFHGVIQDEIDEIKKMAESLKKE